MHFFYWSKYNAKKLQAAANQCPENMIHLG